MASNSCVSCGRVIPRGYAFCPHCDAPVLSPALARSPQLSTRRLTLLYLNVALLVACFALVLFTFIAPPAATGTSPQNTATLPPSATIQTTIDARLTPTTLGTAAPTHSATATPPSHGGTVPTATPTHPAPTATATPIPPTATPVPTGNPVG